MSIIHPLRKKCHCCVLTAETRIVLKGTAEQISAAKALIEEKVKEEEDMRRGLERSIANRSPRREPKDNYNYLVAAPEEQVFNIVHFSHSLN